MIEIPDDITLADKIRNAGFKATPQRLSIYRAVLESKEHPKAENVYLRLRESHPSFTLGTVYRTLESFATSGLIKEAFHTGQSKRYDGNMEPHHHLICQQCQCVIDLPLQSLNYPKMPKQVEGFIPQSMQVQIIGTCGDCQNTTNHNNNKELLDGGS